MRRGTLITTTGIDGAGKSTLAKNVRDELQERGYDAVYAYGRFLPLISYPVMELGRRTVLSDSDMEKDYAQHQSNKADLFDASLLRRGYETLVMADYAPQLFARVIVPLYQHDYVICDRYFYDTLLTDLSGDVISEPQEVVNRYRIYSKLIPSPDFEFYIQIPPEVSMERKDDIPDIGYLHDRKRFYDVFAESYDMSTLDGTASQSELCSTVVNTVLG
jgi:dTMP kinase